MLKQESQNLSVHLGNLEKRMKGLRCKRDRRRFCAFEQLQSGHKQDTCFDTFIFQPVIAAMRQLQWLLKEKQKPNQRLRRDQAQHANDNQPKHQDFSHATSQAAAFNL